MLKCTLSARKEQKSHFYSIFYIVAIAVLQVWCVAKFATVGLLRLINVLHICSFFAISFVLSKITPCLVVVRAFRTATFASSSPSDFQTWYWFFQLQDGWCIVCENTLISHNRRNWRSSRLRPLSWRLMEINVQNINSHQSSCFDLFAYDTLNCLSYYEIWIVYHHTISFIISKHMVVIYYRVQRYVHLYKEIFAHVTFKS